MMKRCFAVLFFGLALLTTPIAHSAPAKEHTWSIFWGFGPNFSPLGNLRIGYRALEVGIINSTGLGAVYVARTSSPLFAEFGALVTGRGLGVVGGMGAAFELASWLDLRMETSIFADTGAVTGATASLGFVAGF